MRIMTVAARMFGEQGLKETTIDNICGDCRITKREFYVYFESKEHLLLEIITQWINKSGKQLRMIPSFSFNAITELQSFFSFIESIPNSFQIQVQVHYPALWQRLSYFRDTEIYPFLIRNINRGLQEELYKPSADKSLLAHLYYHQATAVANNAELLHEMHLIFLQGILSNKGLKYLTML